VTETYQSTNVEMFNLTLKYINEGHPIIYQGVLHNYDNMKVNRTDNNAYDVDPNIIKLQLLLKQLTLYFEKQCDLLNQHHKKTQQKQFNETYTDLIYKSKKNLFLTDMNYLYRNIKELISEISLIDVYNLLSDLIV
jgi:hypothetical protein